jgi:MFS transporter, SP family, sugar:H+ symporter
MLMNSFAVSFSIPHPDYANLGRKVGFIFGSILVLSMFFAYIFTPECKDEPLEQIDYLFNSGTRLRDFGKVPAASVAQDAVFENPVARQDVEEAAVTINSKSL